MSLDPFLTVTSMLKENWLALFRDPSFPYSLNPSTVYFSRVNDPIFSTSLICVYASLITSLLGTLTGEYSWVDRIWSIIPFVYTWLYFLHPYIVLEEAVPDLSLTGLLGSRLFVMTLLTSLWGLRLTYNFWRKGGYAPGGEDYRWEEVKSWFNPVTWQLFNFTFIGFYQNFLLWSITLPAYAAWLGRDNRFHQYDLIPTNLFLLFLSLETIADQQQWNFQETKKRIKSRGEVLKGDYEDGFLQSGLFRYSRHPNFFSEFSLWWCFYLFSITAFIDPTSFNVATMFRELVNKFINDEFNIMTFTQWSSCINFTIIGACLLTMLFHSSTDLTEEMSSKKYSKYKEYQRSTSRLIFWFPGKSKSA